MLLQFIDIIVIVVPAIIIIAVMLIDYYVLVILSYSLYLSLSLTHSYALSLTHSHSLYLPLSLSPTPRLCAARDMSLSMSQTIPLDKDADARARAEDETAGEMEVTIESTATGTTTSTRKHRNSGTKPPYQAFLGQLYALIEGAIDANRYEDSCRQLLGNKSYTLFGLDKVIQQTLKCLQAMTNDESVNRLIGLFVYHKSRGRSVVNCTLSQNGVATAPSSSFPSTSSATSTSTSAPTNTVTATAASVVGSGSEEGGGVVGEESVSVAMEIDCTTHNEESSSTVIENTTGNNGFNGNSVDVTEYQAHVSRVLVNFTEDIYRIQLLSLGSFESESEYQHVACQCLGVLGVGGVPLYSPPAIASLALSAATATATAGGISTSQTLSVPLSSTTFASISNVTATVYDIAGTVCADDLSTSALEESLLPSAPSFSLTLASPRSGSISLSHPIGLTHTIHPVLSLHKDIEKENEGEPFWEDPKDSREASESTIYPDVKSNNINITFPKHDINEMKIKDEIQNLNQISANTSMDINNVKDEKIDDYDFRKVEREREGEPFEISEIDKETDLNMNGEPVNVAETEEREVVEGGEEGREQGGEENDYMNVEKDNESL